MATRTERDDFARETSNTPQGDLALFSGTFEIDHFDSREGILLDVTYRLDIVTAATGGLINDGATPFGSAVALYAVDLDPDDIDADDVDAFVRLAPDSGLPAQPLLPGTASAPVFFRVSASSGPRDAGDPGDFLGRGKIGFEFDAGSGVTALGGTALGSQGNNFTSVNTGSLIVTYDYRAAIDGTARGETVRGTAEADVLLGLGGNDRLTGRAGDDRLHGDRGRDRLEGGIGDDDLSGGRGNDRLAGGRGDDLLRGGNGADTFVLTAGPGQDQVEDWDGRDRLDLRSLDARRGDLELTASGRDLQVLVDGDLVAVLVDTTAGEVSRGDVLF